MTQLDELLDVDPAALLQRGVMLGFAGKIPIARPNSSPLVNDLKRATPQYLSGTLGID